MLQDFVQVDLLGVGVQKQCTPPFIHMPPPPLVIPHPRLHTLPLFPHLGAHQIPLPHFHTPTPLMHSTLHPWVAPRPARTHFAPLPFASQVALPIIPCLPHMWSPCVRSSPDTWPLMRSPLACGLPLTRGTLAHGPLCAALPLRTPPSLLHFQHAHKRGGWHAGMVGHAGEVGHGGRCSLGAEDCPH